MNNFFRLLYCWLLLFSVNQPIFSQTLQCPEFNGPSTGGTSSVFSQNWSTNLSTGTKIIPTVIHLIGSSTNLLDSEITPAIARLNADFLDPTGLHSFRFVLAKISPNGACTNGIVRWENVSYSDPLLKINTKWPNDKYYNIWVVNDPNILGGVEVLPSKFTVSGNQIIRTDNIAGQPTGFATFDEYDGLKIAANQIYPNTLNGRTITHETGHWLNLLHIFSPCEALVNPAVWDCCHDPSQDSTQGDFIPDTPPQKVFANGDSSICGQNISTCNNSTVSLDNFMGYGGPCINSFTPGQRAWMTYCADNFRPLIWSEENLRCTGTGDIFQGSVIATGSNINWNLNNTPSGKITIYGSLIIEPSASLTISSGITVQFCDQGKLIVKQGAALYHYGTLTNSCNGLKWQGVEVWGNKIQPQSGTQGRMFMYAGAVVEHAKVGVWLNNPSDITGNSTGGVLRCISGIFRNNVRGVRFDPYENKTPFSLVFNNASSFTGCLFENDNRYKGSPFESFAYLKGVRGVPFSGCTFQNLDTIPKPPADYGIGINAIESSFAVSGLCSFTPQLPGGCPSSDLTKCVFKYLYTGVSINTSGVNSGLALSYQISDAAFEGNWEGIRSTSSSRGVIIRNNFKLGFLPPYFLSTDKVQGLIFDGTHTSFTVEENSFFQDSNPNTNSGLTTTGIESVSTGSTNKIIRKNYFNNLKIGNFAAGNNADSSGTTGLLYLCNENSGNENFDFILGGNARIRVDQGLPTSPQQIRSAGNFFSHTGPIDSDSDFKNKFDIRYHHDNLQETPIFFDPSRLTLVQAPIRSCESIFCFPPCRTEAEIIIREDRIDAAILEYNDVKALYFAPRSDAALASERKMQMEQLQYEIQTLSADVLSHISFTNGDRTRYRNRLAAINAYDTDLALATDYLGDNDLINYHLVINSIASKHGLSGSRLASFNAYKGITDMLAQQYADGGNKYNLSELEVDWLKIIADNNLFIQARGFAKQILRIYDIYYPVDYTTDTDIKERNAPWTIQTEPDFYKVYPNPVADNLYILFEKPRDGLTQEGILKLLDARGNIVSERAINIGNESTIQVSVADIPNGIYFIQAILGSGQSGIQPVIILH